MLGPMRVPRPDASPGRPGLCPRVCPRPRPLAAALLLLAAVAWVPRPSSADGDSSPKFGTISTSSQYYELPPKLFPKQGAPGVQLRTGGNPPTAPPKATPPSGNDTFTISLKPNPSSVENSTLSSALNFTLPPVLFPSIPTHPSSGVNSTLSDSPSSSSTLTAEQNTTTYALTTSHASNLSLNSTSYAPNPSLTRTSHAPNTSPPGTAANLPNVTATLTPPTSLGKQPFIEPSRSAAVLVGIFVSIAVIGYVGLMVWRRFLERKYGNREVLINEEDFDPSDLKHFEL